MNSRGRHIAAVDAVNSLPGEAGAAFRELFRHGSLSVEVYAPRGVDLQQPHERDEAYVVIAGNGEFRCADERTRFTAGDFLFVPAGVEHRFESFSDDFAAWVLFYGPVGAERET